MGEYVLSVAQHDAIVEAAFLQRGFDAAEARDAARLASMASWHGIRTHNAIKALHLDDLFGSRAGGCVPKAQVEVLDRGRFSAAQRWNANRKLGQSVAFAAMEECMRMADAHGVGIVTVDNCFHYLWGGGYVIEAAKRGYVAYTNCTSTLAEVVPHGGVAPTLGTNPHSWGFPTVPQLGYPVVVDWATSTVPPLSAPRPIPRAPQRRPPLLRNTATRAPRSIPQPHRPARSQVAMGRVQQLAREGQPLPPGVAIDAAGADTTDPARVAALKPFGAHKARPAAARPAAPECRDVARNAESQPPPPPYCCPYPCPYCTLTPSHPNGGCS
jgi:LDH2 family malate/lactate/ureidoglycolate dehydrogenase